MFVDASALVAILTDEPGSQELTAQIDQADACITSAIAVWETIIRLMSKRRIPESEARAELTVLLNEADMEIITIGEREAALATQAYDQFGKGRHPAALNMGDCFAYACARANGMPLLYVGNDFAQTDVNDRYA